MKAYILYFSLYFFLTLQHTVPTVSLSIIVWFQNSIESKQLQNPASNPHMLWIRISMNMYLGNERQMVFQSVFPLSLLSTQNGLHKSSPFSSYQNSCNDFINLFFHTSVSTNSNPLNVFSIAIFLIVFPLLLLYIIIHFSIESYCIHSPNFLNEKSH